MNIRKGYKFFDTKKELHEYFKQCKKLATEDNLSIYPVVKIFDEDFNKIDKLLNSTRAAVKYMNNNGIRGNIGIA